MVIDKESTDNTVDLRTKAEAKVAVQASANESLSGQDVKRLLHELQIHQVELEMQNEVLICTKLNLEATRDSYFDLYDLAPVGYLTLNKEGLIQRSNLTAVAMLGLEKDALINRPIQIFIFRDDIDSYYLQSRSAIETSEDFKLELRLVKADGSPFWVSLQASLQNDDELWLAFSDIGDRKQLEQSLRQANDTLEEQVAERTEELSTTVTKLQQEIAERKQLEEALQASKLHLKTAQHIACIGSWSLDLISGKLIWSDEIFRIFEIDPNQFSATYEAFLDAIYPEDRDAVDRAYTESLTNHTPYEIIHRLIMPDGRVKWVQERCTSEFDEAGKAKRSTGTVQDITERKMADESLLLARFSINRSSDGFFWMTPDARIVDVNDAACRSLGYSKEELLQLTIPDIDPFYNANVWQQHFIDLRQQGSLKFETVHTTKDGIQFPVEIAANYIKFGSEEYNCGIVRNITERKQAEEDKLALDRRFQESQKLESLGVLAGGIAHDFNNILCVIISSCSLAQLRPDMSGKLLTEIDNAAQRAAELCRQMLAYAGKSLITMKRINMTELVTDLINMLKVTIKQNVAITSDLSGNLPSTLGDASQLRQVVMNLIINASEAFDEEQGEIHVTLTMIEIEAGQSIKDYFGTDIVPGCYACLEVSDTGCGMDDDVMQRIFEPFYTTKFTGRGLGMSAVIGIITSHKGSLQLFSQVGKGTTFKVYLPALGCDSAGDKSQQQVVPAPWKGSGTILLVDDEVQIMAVAKALLETMGFSVIEALNGNEAIEQYQKYAAEISMVLTDIGMPVMDGYELFRELKKINPKLPIIVSSGFAESDVLSHIARADIAGLVSKPYRYDQMREVLKEACGGCRVESKEVT